MNQNPTFSAWSGTASVGPDNWFAVNAGNGVLSKGPGANGQPQSLRAASSSTANYSVNSSTFAGAVGGEWLALTVEFTLVSGDLRGSGVQIHKRQDGSQIGSSLNLNFATEADAAGNVAGSGVAGRRYSFTKLLDGRQAGVNGYSIFGRTRLSTFSPVGAATLDWHRLSARTATAEEVAAGTVLPAVEGQLAIVGAVAADAADRLASVRFDVTGGAGGDPFQIWGRAGPDGSMAGLVASELNLSNVVNGQVVKALSLIGGDAHFANRIFAGLAKQIVIDPTYPAIITTMGNARKAEGQLPNDNLIYWFGPKVEVSQMRKSNATEWKDGAGNARMAGTLLSGAISNNIQGSNTSVPASVTLGPFGTSGGPITLNWSYEFSRTGRRWGDQTGTVSGSTSALIRLYRRIGGGAETLVDSMTVTGDLNAYYEGEPVPGQPSGTVGQTFFTEYMGSSRTYQDTVGGTQSRTYRIEVVSRSLRGVAGDSPEMDNMSQRYGIISGE
ncbi:MAG TPA: hypothetical protein DCG71_06500 [Brevundimonas sp.]|nr:hypothetical protein [Brevundimonas sp.]